MESIALVEPSKSKNVHNEKHFNKPKLVECRMINNVKIKGKAIDKDLNLANLIGINFHLDIKTS